jgi:hypothetical protein
VLPQGLADLALVGRTDRCLLAVLYVVLHFDCVVADDQRVLASPLL